MRLEELIDRVNPPIPWSEGDNIPWNEPGFSKRMLREHLSQEHDAASRKVGFIDQQVNWIHSNILHRQRTRILDLACGPGMYTERLARLGHRCWGIDYSPASIEYAVATAQREQLDCIYTCQDIRVCDYPAEMGLVMLIYGEFNAFRPSDARLLLGKAWQALKPGGWLVLEPHEYEMVQELGQKPASWYTSLGGLFSERAHTVLQENFWDEGSRAATTRYYVIDATTGDVSRYAHSLQAYRDEEYHALIAEQGFEDVHIFPGLSGKHIFKGLIAITGRKPGMITVG